MHSISPSRRPRSKFAQLALSSVAVLSLAAVARSAPSTPAEPPLDGARILYVSGGGLAGIRQELRVFDDGFVRYDWSRFSESSSYTLHDRLPLAEVAALKRLFLIGDFESMPPRYTPEFVVIDGARFLVKVELRDGSLKSVRSETLAVESQAFTAIRRTLEGIIADVRGQEILRMRSYFFPVDGRERFFTLLGDGRYRIEFRQDSIPVRWIEGTLRPVERSEFLALIGEFDFTKVRLCEGLHLKGVQHDVVRISESNEIGMHYSEADTAPRFDCLTMIAGMIDDIVKAER